MDSSPTHTLVVVTLTVFSAKTVDCRTILQVVIIFFPKYQVISAAKVMPESKLGESQELQKNHHDASTGMLGAHSNDVSFSSAVVNYTKTGTPGIMEKLGNFQRISNISCLLFLNCVLVGLSTYLILNAELSDLQWQKIIEGARFPTLRTPKKVTYFEKTKLLDTEVGRLIIHRKDFTVDKVNFGMARSSRMHEAQLSVLVASLLFCVLHLTSCCIFKRARRNFQLISVAYGFIGLFMFCLCLMTLYFAFVHKVASYLENGMSAPNLSKVKPAVGNASLELFVNLCFACAFAFSEPNRFARDQYPVVVPEDASFTIENVTYNRMEMMDLGICPRQDYLLGAVFTLAVTSIFCWLAASYSETLENQIIGPPVWLQRFKMKIHNGIRHWSTRRNIPSYLNLHSHKDSENYGSDETVAAHDHGDHPIHFHNSMTKYTKTEDEMSYPTWHDAYDVLDGGMDHIILTEPDSEKVASNLRLYPSASSTAMSVLKM